MRNGRTGRGYKTVVRLLREFTDLTEYSYDTEVVMMLGQESLSESCCSKLGRHAGGDSRWEKTSLIERKGVTGLSEVRGHRIQWGLQISQALLSPFL